MHAVRAGADPLRSEVLPRVATGVFCALMLAAVSCVVTLVLAYLSVYGSTLSGFAAYTRTVGHVFNPAVSLIFGLKIVFLGIDGRADARSPRCSTRRHACAGGRAPSCRAWCACSW